IETQVTSLSARAGSGGVFVLEADGLAVDDVAASVGRVGSDATTGALSDATQSDLVTSANGAIVVRSSTGSITLNDGTGAADGRAVSANGSGNVLLQTLAADGDLVVNADVLSGSGAISLLAGRSLLLNGGADLSNSGASIDLDAAAGLTMAASASARAAAGSLRAHAAGDIVLGSLSADALSVRSDAGAISRAAGSATNLSAASLRLQANGAIGTALNPLTLAAGTLSARSAGVGSAGLFLSEADAVTVDTVAVSVARVSAAGTTSSVTDAAQADLVALGGGDIVLQAAGNLTLNDGSGSGVGTGDGVAVSTQGAGNVRLVSQGGAVTVNAGLVTDRGNVDLSSRQSVVWGGTGRTVSTSATAAGTLTIQPVSATQAMTIGSTAPSGAAAGGWFFNTADLGRLATGYAQVVIGGDTQTGDITIDGRVNPVRFDSPVEVRAAAGATVRIEGDVQATSLRIVGAAQVLVRDANLTATTPAGIRFSGSATLAGNVVLTTDALSLDGGAGSLQAADPTATLTLLTQGPARTVFVGSAAVAQDGLLVGSQTLAALGDGFARIEIGRAGQTGALQVVGNAAFGDAVTLWGSTLTMAAGSSLNALGDVALMARDGLVVDHIAAAGQTVTLRSEGVGSTISAQPPAAGAPVTPHIVADRVDLQGMGPLLGHGNAVQVQAGAVNVLAPSGMVARQTQANGDVNYVVMSGGSVYLQLVDSITHSVASGQVGLPAPTSVSQTATLVAANRVRASAYLLPIDPIAPLSQVLHLGDPGAIAASAGWRAAQGAGVSAQVARLASADIVLTASGSSDDAVPDWSHAYLLGELDRQPTSSGVAMVGAGAFDYWVESLTL
ncbi:MAG: beta strand repeat-containing protein, partial [Leptothrix sp. (in: b-proteobacteria)]